MIKTKFEFDQAVKLQKDIESLKKEIELLERIENRQVGAPLYARVEISIYQLQGASLNMKPNPPIERIQIDELDILDRDKTIKETLEVKRKQLDDMQMSFDLTFVNE